MLDGWLCLLVLAGVWVAGARGGRCQTIGLAGGIAAAGQPVLLRPAGLNKDGEAAVEPMDARATVARVLWRAADGAVALAPGGSGPVLPGYEGLPVGASGSGLENTVKMEAPTVRGAAPVAMPLRVGPVTRCGRTCTPGGTAPWMDASALTVRAQGLSGAAPAGVVSLEVLVTVTR